jgi:hypothetical protein
MHRFAIGGDDIARRSVVILDVASAHGGARVNILELGENLAGATVDGIDDDVEAAAMAHSEDRTVDTVICRSGKELV